MANRLRRIIAGLVVVSVVVSGCSTPEREAAPSAAVGLSAEEGCAAGADRLVARLERFLAELPDIEPEEFLALEQVDGLVEFQNDVAQILADTTDQRSTLCNLDGFQELVAERLVDVEREGLLAEFLIATIRDGRELTTADVEVTPDDDVEAVLGLLDDGSTITFAAGTYELERPLLIQRSIAVVGDGVGSTMLRSQASDAAIVVVGRGRLLARDMAVEHVGDEPASVILAFDRPVDLARIRLTGGVTDPEGGAGNGLVLTDEAFGGQRFDDVEAQRSVVIDSILEDNAGAGIALDGAVAPRVENSELTGNGICGVCFFGTAAGEVVGADIHGNDFGIQVGDQAAPLIRRSRVSGNTTAGIVVVGDAAPTIDGGEIASNGDIGLAIQERGAPIVLATRFEGHRFAVSALSDTTTVVRDSEIVGAEVGVQVDDRGVVELAGLEIDGTTLAALAVSGEGTASLDGLEIRPAAGLGLVGEGGAVIDAEGVVVTGGEVGMAFTGSVTGSIRNTVVREATIGVQIDDGASPALADLEIFDVVEAGVVARGESAATVERASVVGAGTVGFAMSDDVTVTLDRVVVRSSPTGAAVIGSARPTIRSGEFSDVDVGLQIAEQAEPVIEENSILEPRAAGLVYVDEGAGSARRNDIRDPGVVGIQLGDRARPELGENVLFRSRPEPAGDDAVVPDADDTDPDDEPAETDTDAPTDGGDRGVGGDRDGVEGDPTAPELVEDATVGILYAGTSSGTAAANQIIGFVIGVQVGERAEPDIEDNVIDGGVLAGVGVLYRDDASGAARANRTAAHAVGFQIGDSATPLVTENVIESARNVAILVQGAADPRLEQNVCPEDLVGIGLLDGVDPARVDNDCIEVVGE